MSYESGGLGTYERVMFGVTGIIAHDIFNQIGQGKLNFTAYLNDLKSGLGYTPDMLGANEKNPIIANYFMALKKMPQAVAESVAKKFSEKKLPKEQLPIFQRSINDLTDEITGTLHEEGARESAILYPLLAEMIGEKSEKTEDSKEPNEIL